MSASAILLSWWFWCALASGVALVAASWYLSVRDAPVVSDITPDLEGAGRPLPGSWAERDVQAMGFTYCGDYVCDFGSRRARRLLVYLSSDWTHWALLGSDTKDRTRFRSVEFATSFEPDMAVRSTSRAFSGSLLPVAREFWVVRPFQTSPRALFRTHLRFCGVACDAGARAVRVRPRDFRVWFRDEWERSVEILAERGMVRSERDRQVVRLKGIGVGAAVLAARAVRYGPLLWLPASGVWQRRRMWRRMRRALKGVEEAEERVEEPVPAEGDSNPSRCVAAQRDVRELEGPALQASRQGVCSLDPERGAEGRHVE